jgi:hypothetical protein
MGDECHAPGKDTWYTFYKRIGVHRDVYGWICKNSLPFGFKLRIIRPRSESHTEYALPAAHIYVHRTTIEIAQFSDCPYKRNVVKDVLQLSHQ